MTRLDGGCSMSEHVEAALSNLDQLAASFTTLAEHLEMAAQSIRANGVLPDRSLVEQIEAAHTELDALVAYVHQELVTCADAPDIRSLEAIPSLLEALTRIRENSQNRSEQLFRVRGWLIQVLELRYNGTNDFAPLAKVQSQSRELISAIDAGDTTVVETIGADDHPLIALVRLVTEREQLTVEEIDELDEIVTEGLGRKLALAATTGRLQPTRVVPDSSQIELRFAEADPYSVHPNVDLSSMVNEPGDEEVEAPEDIRNEVVSSEDVLVLGSTSVIVCTHAPDQCIEEGVPGELEDLADALEPIDVTLDGVAEPQRIPVSILPDPKALHLQMVDPAKVNADSQLSEVEAASPAEPLPEGIAEGIAYKLLRGDTKDRTAAIWRIIWQLLRDNRGSLAYHLTRYLAANSEHFMFGPELIRALLLGATVRYDMGDTAALLRDDFSLFSPIVDEKDGDAIDAQVLFRAASALRAALIAPNTGAYTVLQALPARPGLDEFGNYCTVIANYGANLQPLDTKNLLLAYDRASWKAELDAVQREVSAWSSQANFRTIKFERASRVWRFWQQPNGLIARLLKVVQDDDVTQIKFVQSELERLADPEAIRREVNTTDRKNVGALRRGADEITGAALNQIRQYTGRALDFVRRWVVLQNNRPDGNQNYLQQQAEQLRAQVIALQGIVLSELEHFAEQRSPLGPPLAAAIECCRRAVLEIGSLFDEASELRVEETPPRYMLHLDLLRCTGILTDDNWEPLLPASQLEPMLLRAVRHLGTPWTTILDGWSELRDHAITERIITGLEVMGYNQDEVLLLDQRRNRHLKDCRAALHHDIVATRGEIESAVAYGILRETERLNLIADIQAIENENKDGKSGALRFMPLHNRLELIRRQIVEERQRRLENTRQRLESIGISPEHPAYERIDALLASGDDLTANEYIDLIGDNQALPDLQPEHDLLRVFFPDFVTKVTHFLDNEAPPRYIDRLISTIRGFATGNRRSYNIAGFEHQRVAGPQASEAADLLEAWFSAKDKKHLETSVAKRVLASLGFNVRHLQSQQRGRLVHYSLVTQVVQDRRLCPVRRYGSEAKGRYNLLCAWDRPTESEILTALEPIAHQEPAIIFYFGRMTEMRRREIVRLGQERRRTYLLIDDLLILYLATLRPPRMPHLFDLAIPFTYIDPYSTTAGLVPPEIFYGRRREREQILDPMDSCFIYGGRQLGKTALLRDVERTYHDAEKGFIVSWIDLKVEGIGNERSIDAIWRVIARELQRHGVLDQGTPLHISDDRLLEYVFNWLEADPARRILLLLDEADRFLESDGRSTGDNRDAFRHSSKLKGLMDRTQRRFKVVFAGLHNVQRTTRQANHPLAHYGDPICIGPLLDNGEWRAAHDLVQRPLANAGYVFESSDLITRILSQTNYYPSLIQLYCKQLLKHLLQSQTLYSGPPYIITEQHVEDVYRSSDLRDAIRQRFDLTIQLDARYEVIAYIVAFWSLMDEGRGMVEGFSLADIRTQALASWPEGFAERDSEDLFHSLLDEMVGLGVLREVSPKYFSLRSPNVVLLMGTDEEILEKLDRKREPPVDYEPATFRTAFRDESRNGTIDLSRRSPLTALQESELQSRVSGVSIICGCLATGRDELAPFLRLLFGSRYMMEFEFLTDRTSFKRNLDNALRQRPDNGTTLILVPAICAWSIEWVGDALDALSSLRARNSWVRVVFIAEPTTLWRLLQSEPVEWGGELVPGTTLISLRPWHDNALRQWLEDCSFSVTDKQTRERIRKVTGNWPWLLRKFYDATHLNTRYWVNALNDLEEQVVSGSLNDELISQFELRLDAPNRVLQTIAEWSPTSAISFSDLLEVLGAELPVETVYRSLRWADLLSLAKKTRDEAWQLDPIVVHSLGKTHG